jgi:hypothetical protein
LVKIHCLANKTKSKNNNKSYKNNKNKNKNNNNNASRRERIRNVAIAFTPSSEHIDRVNALCKQFNAKNPTNLVTMLTKGAFSSSIVGIPDSIKTTLRYSVVIGHTHTSGTAQTYRFRGNSVYDPDYTSTGHQPVGFDEFSAFFQYYRVVASKIILKASSVSTDTPIILTVRPVRELVATSSWIPAVESPRCVFEYVPTVYIPAVDLENHATMRDIFSGQDSTDQDFGSVISANPSKEWYWEILSQTYDGTTSSTIRFQVVVEYDVIFSQKQVLGTS